jgi:hypothetical protein
VLVNKGGLFDKLFSWSKKKDMNCEYQVEFLFDGDF